MPLSGQRITLTNFIVGFLFVIVVFVNGPANAQISEPIISDDTPDTAIILFDQSGSMGRFNPLAISRIWLSIFSKTFFNPHQVKLVGFDENFNTPLTIETGPDTDLASITRITKKITPKGRVTDLESPFRYLAKYQNLNKVSLILFISDGEPEIWDNKIGYLSAFVRNDTRYQELNDTYTQLKASKQTNPAQFDLLRQRYYKRNLQLINKRLEGLATEIGSKTIIWDISGHSQHLKEWALTLGAEYLGARIAQQEDPVDQLQDALQSLQATTSALIKIPLPKDHQTQIENVLSTVPDPPPLATPTPEVPQLIEPHQMVKSESLPAQQPKTKIKPIPPPKATGNIELYTTQPEPNSYPNSNTAPDPSLFGGVFLLGLISMAGSLLWLIWGKKKYLLLQTHQLYPSILPISDKNK